jgi:putative ABC transport system substrate-binding protein
MNTRRKILIALGAGTLAAPLLSFAQQHGKVWRVGLMHIGLEHVPPSFDGLREGLKALGYIEGGNIRLDFRNLANREAALETAREFVRDRFDLVIAFERQSIHAAHAVITSIPVVMLHISNPDLEGLIKSLAHPGGNMTGFAGVGEVPAKELELFKELYPKLSRPLVLFNPAEASSARWIKELRAAADTLKLQLVEREATDAKTIEQVFRSLKPGAVDGFIYGSPALRHDHQVLFVDLSRKYRLPMLGHREEWVERGALFSYNVNYAQSATRPPDVTSIGFSKARSLPICRSRKFPNSTW